MLFTGLPDSDRYNMNAPIPPHGWPNIVAWSHADEPYFVDKHFGPLSIKCTLKGQEVYEIDGQPPLIVDENSYLVLNEGQRYSSYTPIPDVVSFCIFFRIGLAEEVAAALSMRTDKLLLDPLARPRGRLVFEERLYPHDAIVSAQIARFKSLIKQNDNSDHGLEEQYHLLIERLLLQNGLVQAEIERLPFVRASTRNEVYRRLHLARDYIWTNCASGIGLKEVAAIAGFSQHHFLRLFNTVFNQTPHQYLTHLRLEKARGLLRSTSKSISDIAAETGFSTPQAFSKIFRMRFGVTPTEFRSSL